MSAGFVCSLLFMLPQQPHARTHDRLRRSRQRDRSAVSSQHTSALRADYPVLHVDALFLSTKAPWPGITASLFGGGASPCAWRGECEPGGGAAPPGPPCHGGELPLLSPSSPHCPRCAGPSLLADRNTARVHDAQAVVSTDRRHGRCGSGQQRREQRCGGGRRVRATTQARRANRAVRLERAARRQSAEAAQERQPGPKRPQAQGGQPAAPRLARCGHRPAAPRLLQPARRAARLVRPARSPRGVRACAGDCP